MKLIPSFVSTHFFGQDPDDSFFQCCDSVVAVLTPTQIMEWLEVFNKSVQDPEADQFSDGTTTQIFDIDGVSLVVVADTGGEFATGEFQLFCEDRDIPSQFIIDSLECEGIAPDEIYTGEYDNNLYLLSLVHRIYN